MYKPKDFSKRIEAANDVQPKRYDFSRQQLAQQVDGRATSSNYGYGGGQSGSKYKAVPPFRKLTYMEERNPEIVDKPFILTAAYIDGDKDPWAWIEEEPPQHYQERLKQIEEFADHYLDMNIIDSESEKAPIREAMRKNPMDPSEFHRFKTIVMQYSHEYDNDYLQSCIEDLAKYYTNYQR